ncbi:reprolysin-like metallopeptidase [uncultured Polaribacter sp.]|uniref:zinc-dependent metalloprotease n=1 Tax=uncultured Polaribacter sp. TaxID=174711 RepID=UPI002623568B|nr:zinc-dependent metalloprotease family protein [uncultured Polaribacter sp.]
MIKKYVFIFICFSVFSAFSQQKIWTPNSLERTTFLEDELYFRKSVPTNFKQYSLNINDLKKILDKKTTNTDQIIHLPTANGTLEKFVVKEASVLAKGLSKKFPMIKSYVGQGVESPDMTARFSIGTDGLHVAILSSKNQTFYIDPLTKSNQNYIAYKKSDLDNSNEFECFLDEDNNSSLTASYNIPQMRNSDDGKLRTFRLALVCSGEYAEFHLNNQGVEILSDLAVRQAAVLSAMNTSMTRINAVYERDLGVRMVIVDDNDKVLFFRASLDGITDGDADEMIDEVQTICDAEIGDANYDIGHIFSTGGSGLAGLGVVCRTGVKAKGVTGIASPIGDPYDIDYVAHEMGHQFGATHTQNNSCNRTASTAVEPGSASTIMGYAGICAPNVQTNSDDHFHAVSIAQMWDIIETTANCAVLTDTNNNAPTADAGLDYSIPLSTPFVLRGIATDADQSNVLTYNWEQLDVEIATMPPLETNTAGPTFRSLPSSTSPNRYMPALSTIVSGATSTEWEVLPARNRDMNFSFFVRDNNPGGGSTARDDVKVTSVFGNKFSVTSQNTAVIWDKETTQTVTWDVSASDVAPVNCQIVNIRLSIDGGVTFPILLATNTANDGTEDIIVPDNGTTQARIMVEAADNIFYNVNSTDFTINGATTSVGDFSFDGFNLYPNPSKGIFTLNFEVLNTDKVSIQLFDVRGRLIKQKKYYNTNAVFNKQIDFSNTQTGLYLIRVSNGNKQTTKRLLIN